MTKALYWEKQGAKVACRLCNHNCTIAEGAVGICGVRENRGGTLDSIIYGKASSIATDPIEKKPLYHFHPGSYALSLGTVGCNFKCDNCQNYSISQARPRTYNLRSLDPEKIPEMARTQRCQGVAWTYNEPTVWYETTLEGSKAAKKAGLYSVYVTNGYISEEPLREISPYLDAMNVDVKAFSDGFYKKVSKARLQPVLDTCILAKELGIHIELTYLVIPGLNDKQGEIARYCDWVVENLGARTPLHFSRFHPDYKMTDRGATPLGTLDMAYKAAAAAGAKYVYLGNVPPSARENTLCPKCGALLIARAGFRAKREKLAAGKCTECGAETGIVE